MVRKDGAEVRRQRMREVDQAVLKALQKENPLSLSKVLASLQYTTGLTRARLLEYLELLQDLGHFIIDCDKDQIRELTEA